MSLRTGIDYQNTLMQYMGWWDSWQLWSNPDLAFIDPPKRNEMYGRVTPHGIPLELSMQYVNWPQIFRLDYLKAFIEPFKNSKTYLECAEFDGRVGQLRDRWQYGIYSPEGEIRRCYHLHGRCIGIREIAKPYVEIDGRQRYVGEPYTRP